MPLALVLMMAVSSMSADPNDYALAQNWLCRPGRRDVCTVDQKVTRVDTDGRLTEEPTKTVAEPDADCFYVYPTTSLDASGNSDMVANAEERDRVTEQFARFASVCKTFAPIYRQLTLTALRARMRGQASNADPELGYRDIRDSWRDYLARDNGGRPFVLIGHSQGSMVLQRLIAEEIDGKPVQKRMLSAILPGTNLMVPSGKDVGGDFKSIPLCRTDSQTGCVVVWASYRDSNPPPVNALFGVSQRQGMEAACTNPAKLDGGAAQLDSIFGFPWWRGGYAQGVKPDGWKIDGKPVPTQFARVPGRLSGVCVKGPYANYLAVHVNAAPRSAFDRELTDEAMIGDKAFPDWGWHVVDIAIVQGDLLRLVSTQSAAWHKAQH